MSGNTAPDNTPRNTAPDNTPRNTKVEGCDFCDKYHGQGPPHYISHNCKGGGRPHCSCGPCF